MAHKSEASPGLRSEKQQNQLGVREGPEGNNSSQKMQPDSNDITAAPSEKDPVITSKDNTAKYELSL